MTSKQLHEENTGLMNNTHKILKKYLAVRQIIHTLHVSRSSSIPTS